MFDLQVVSAITLPSGLDRKTMTGICSGMNWLVKFTVKIGVGGVDVCSSFVQEIIPANRNKSMKSKKRFDFMGYWTCLIS